jgi:hypothetical protein
MKKRVTAPGRSIGAIPLVPKFCLGSELAFCEVDVSGLDMPRRFQNKTKNIRS